MGENKFAVPAAIIIAGALITWGIFSTKGVEAPVTGEEPTSEQPTEEQEPIEVNFRDTDHILGNPNAKIKMITFSDFECPYCKTFHETMVKITDEYAKDGTVAWTLRQFPVHGEPTQIKAAAHECSALLGGENKFWEMTDKIFHKTEAGSWISTEELPTIAKSLGLNENDFNECLKNQNILNKVKSDFDTGVNLGVQGTPFTVVVLESGELIPINGAQPYENVKNMIDTILKESISE